MVGLDDLWTLMILRFCALTWSSGRAERLQLNDLSVPSNPNHSDSLWPRWEVLLE